MLWESLARVRDPCRTLLEMKLDLLNRRCGVRRLLFGAPESAWRGRLSAPPTNLTPGAGTCHTASEVQQSSVPIQHVLLG